jgi:hypothetical protein
MNPFKWEHPFRDGRETIFMSVHKNRYANAGVGIAAKGIKF